MSPAHLISIAVLAAFTQTAGAEESLWPSDALDAANAPVSIYSSAFSGYRGSSEFPELPSKIWHAVNENVGLMDGHAAHTEASATSDHEMAARGHGEPTAAETPEPPQKKKLKRKAKPKAKPKLRRERLPRTGEEE